MKYKLGKAEIIDGEVNLPDGVIPLKMGLILTKPFSDPDTKLADGITYLVAIDEEVVT